MPTGIDSAAGQQNTPGHGFRPGSDKPYVDPKGTINEASGKSQNFRATKPDPKEGEGPNSNSGSIAKLPGVMGPGAGGFSGSAGGGKGATAQKALEGAQQGINKLQQGDIKGGLKTAAKGAVEAVGDEAADKLFKVFAEAFFQTFTLSVLIGWNLLLFLPWVINFFTGIKVTLKGWQKAVIIAMDLAILTLISLGIIIFVSAFCYGLSSGTLSQKLGIALVNPGAALAGAAAKYVLPAEVSNFCSKLSGSGGDFGGGGATDNFGGGPIVASGCSTTESGGCTKAVISACPGMAAQMDNALKACNFESQGGTVGIESTTDYCTEQTTGQKVHFSIGLWQINVFDSSQPEFPECKGVFKETSTPTGPCIKVDNKTGKCIIRDRKCSFGSGGRAAYDSCKTALSNPTRNTRQACTLFNQRGWQPWPNTRSRCNLP